jgi:formamidopyrimidine-DNA glycosylase
MPELPDVELYRERLEAMLLGAPLVRLEVANPFLLRSVSPSPDAFRDLTLRRVRRIGKRLALGFDSDAWAVIHLMIAGRLRWRAEGRKAPAGRAQARFVFPGGTLHFTEAGSKRRASLHLVQGEPALAIFDRGGLEPLTASPDTFAMRVRSARHTLKRALTDPKIFSGIGNAYSDEILFRARLSPLQLTTNLDDAELRRLHEATCAELTSWLVRLRAALGEGFPEEVTAFRPGMAVHGRFGEPCPECGTPVQRIRYAENETNYCARCQTGGRLLADRGMSRLLKEDWPRSIDDVE